jgi:hypothetical protein
MLICVTATCTLPCISLTVLAACMLYTIRYCLYRKTARLAQWPFTVCGAAVACKETLRLLGLRIPELSSITTAVLLGILVLTLVVYAVRKGRYNRLLASEAYKSQQLAAAASGCSVTLVLLGWEVSLFNFIQL